MTIRSAALILACCTALLAGCAGDQKTGDKNGEGVNGVWRTLR